jgi:aspartate aminotransferase
MTRASWIRKMFERGAELKERYGAANVYDLSLGNPVLEPPVEFFEFLAEMSQRRDEGLHRYMQNAGFPPVREAIAQKLAGEMSGLTGDGVIMCVGAGGGLNVALKTVVNPGDEVVILAPFFVEYKFYIANHGGVPVVAETSEDFDVDVGALAEVITHRTRALIINSPNNPTGRLYPRASLDAMVALLREREAEYGHPIYVLADEPYRELVYVDDPPPSAASLHDNGFLIYSWSKSLSIPGERIGFIAVNPKADDPAGLAGGLTFANRILGFVNAPATMQLAAAQLLDVTIDVGWYRERRDRFLDGLRSAGYDVVTPEGTFYVFPRSPDPDDVAFVNRAIEARVLLVPGSGFGRQGFFRLCYSVDDPSIDGGIRALAEVAGA